MAAVHDDREVDAGFQPVERGAQPVVPERIVPVEVGRAEDLVAAVGLVAVVVGHVRAVAGVMHDGDIALLRVAHQLLDAGLHRLLRRGAVGQHGDVALLEAVTLDERGAQVLHVVDASPEIGAGYLVLVDSDQQRSLGHHTLPHPTGTP